MGLAERADVIVDFTGLPVGTELYLINEGPTSRSAAASRSEASSRRIRPPPARS